MSVAARPFRPADIRQQAMIQELAVAPDGSTLVYSRRTIVGNTYRSALWRVSLTGGAPEQLTAGTALDRHPQLSPDGRRLLFLSDRSGAPQPWLLPLAGGEATPLADLPGGARAAEWSPDGHRVVVLAGSGADRFRVGDRADPVARRITDLTWRLDGVGVRDQFTSAWTVPARGGRATRATGSGYEVFHAFWLPEGALGFVADLRPGAALVELPEVWALGAPGAEPRRLAGLGGAVEGVACSPSGVLALVGTDEPHSPWWATRGLYVVADGYPRRLGDELDRWTANTTFGDLVDPDSLLVRAVAWLDDEHVAALVGERGTTLPYLFGLDGSVTPLAAGEVVCTRLAVRGGRIAVVASERGRPGEVCVVEDGRLRPLTRHGSRWLRPFRRDPERVAVPHPDGHEIDAWRLPPRGGSGPAPLVLQIHGGPHLSHGPTPWTEMLALADGGIGVVYANPRGSVGYGERFARSVHGSWGGDDVSDLLRVVEWAVEEGHADPRRLGLLGLSYGGWMACLLAGRFPERWRAVVCENPVSDLVSFFGSSDIGTQTDARLFGVGTLPDDLQEFLRLSPFVEIHRAQAPLLILQAEGDLRCPADQADLLFAILRSKGKPVELVRYPGESHILGLNGRPDKRVDRAERILAWFHRHL